MKQLMRKIEVIFDLTYFILGAWMTFYIWKATIGQVHLTLLFWASFLLIGGDLFHLLPRILTILKDQMKATSGILFQLRSYGMLVSSITLTIFYVLLWQFGQDYFDIHNNGLNLFMYVLALFRIILTLMPQNQWGKIRDNNKWSIYRNIPFILQGLMVIGLYLIHRAQSPYLSLLWLYILLSFVFYIPVFIWVNQKPAVGMLMLPKTVMYLMILFNFCQLVRG